MRISGLGYFGEVMHDIRTAVVQDPTISRVGRKSVFSRLPTDVGHFADNAGPAHPAYVPYRYTREKIDARLTANK